MPTTRRNKLQDGNTYQQGNRAKIGGATPGGSTS